MRPLPRLPLPWLALLLLVGCAGAAPEGLPIPSDSCQIREGLPHPSQEAALFQSEKAGPKPKIEVGGYPLYEATLTVDGQDRRDLLALLNDPGSYRAFSGEKKCGSFHPDYAVEWLVAGKPRTLLLCFGCGEVELVAPDRTTRFDLSTSARTKLLDLLDRHRLNRPQRGASN